MTAAPWASLAGAMFAAAACLGWGRRLMGDTTAPLQFLLGATALSLGVFALGAAGLLAPGTLLALGAVGCLGCRGLRVERPPLAVLAFVPFGFIYLIYALAPEHSPDGVAYHWSLPLRYLREGRLVYDGWSIYAQFPQAMEMLYAFGLAFGPRAPALIHLSFLAALTALMFTWARPHGVALPAAVLLFAAPVVGVDAASAYNDVALAAACFGVFVLSGRESSRREVMAAAALAGFAMSLKYTGALAIIYLLARLAWQRRPARDCAAALAVAALPVLPWLLKNLWFTGNPVSPFFNAWFPNPVFDHALEQNYLTNLRWPATGIPWPEIPAEFLWRGEKLRGFIGPAFLLLPLGFFTPAARPLIPPALLFALPFALNAGTRFLIPALPFWALMIALSIRRLPAAGLAVAALHAIAAWPALMDRYAPTYAWRIREIPFEAAWGVEPETAFLRRHMPETALIPALERTTGPVLALSPFPEAYTRADFRIANHSRPGADAFRAIVALAYPTQRPGTRFRFWFPARRTRALRLRQTTGPPISIAELRAYHLLEPVRTRVVHHQGRPNRFQARQAIDGALFTRWTSWHRPGLPTYFDVEFAADVQVSRLELDVDGIDPLPGIRIETRHSGGPWSLATDVFEVTKGAEEGFDPRDETFTALAAAGIQYVLIQNRDAAQAGLGAFDHPAITGSWRFEVVASSPDARLFHLVRIAP